ncbi:MAG TPA: carbohydrate ABC transporter permease [Acidimicrobiales bacterium]|jgi:sn-glycerol 3-phosphate transport system permease protein|nr:carbohydrate ABC transporter permease [Acidimicrobiales bacterium]
MATSEQAAVTPTRQAPAGRGPSRHAVGVVGQYAMLVVLSILVLGPLLLTLIQAMSPPFIYVEAGKPLHPVNVDWKDRTWFTGGAFSVVARTLVVLVVFTWANKLMVGWDLAGRRVVREWRNLLATVGATVVLAVSLGPAFGSFHAADGNSEWWILLAMALVSATLVPALLATPRGRVGAVLEAVAVGSLITGAALVFVGGAVWTQAWSSARLGPAMGRSLVMTVVITSAQVTSAILAAYAFAFLRFPFRRLLFALFMATLLLPLEVTLIGNIALIRQLEWINTMQALVLPFTASAFGTFLIRQGFRGIPPEINDATRLDGYGHVAFLTKFAVPLTRPVIASFTVIAALGAWNQYLWPASVVSDDRYNTLQFQLRTIIGNNVANANVSIAAAMVAAVPVLVLLIAFQRQIIRGLTAGAVK